MNAQRRFDGIIDLIETEATRSRGARASKIAEMVGRKSGLGGREVNAVFSFLIGMPLLDYIRMRKMMVSYRSYHSYYNFHSYHNGKDLWHSHKRYSSFWGNL